MKSREGYKRVGELEGVQAKVLYQLSRGVRIFASWLPESEHSKAEEALETLQQAIDYVGQRKRMSSLQKVFAKREWDSLVERLKGAHESLKATKRFLQDHFSSSAQVNGNATMPRHTQAVVGVLVPETDMLPKVVSDLNSNCEESTLVVDLKGRTLRIAEPYTTTTLRRSHVVFKNGYMEIALGSRLVIRDEVHDITFSRISISPAPEPGGDPASKEDVRPKGGELHGLLELADANTSVFMKNCELMGGLHCCVAVTGGSVLSLKQCFVSGTSCLLWDGVGEPDLQAGPSRGPCPCDEVSGQLRAAAGTSGVEAAAHAAVQLQGSMWHHGVAVLGRSSMLTAEVCDFHGQGGAAVAVQRGGRAILENTTLHESSGWVGLEVVGAGSDVSLVSCAIRGHAWFGMLAMDGATVSMNKCLLVDNAGGACVVVHGNASEVVARKCEAQGEVLQLEAGRYKAQ